MKILVLAGGDSAERDVSLDSGQCVADALQALGHDVDLRDPATVPVSTWHDRPWDIVFPVVHGTGGEDGRLQSELLAAGLPYVGSSVAASELTFDKIRTNTLLRNHGVAVPENRIIKQTSLTAEVLNDLGDFASFESDSGGVVTKPPRQGSSIGVSIVLQESQLTAALDLAFQYDDVCLVERFIAGREWTVPVIDGTAFPAIEIRTAVDWYDYDAKYQDERTQYVVSPTDEPLSLRSTAVRACEICGVAGIARVDFRVDAAGEPWLLEVNTVPGMTSHSLVPKSAAAAGFSLGQLCEATIRHRLAQ
ncbi:MAG: D-alanine--D-alanine ligase [Planctomycetaceae bacterium]